MSAGKFVGRVGGLAVALGVGAAAYSGTAVAWADAGASGSDSGRVAHQSAERGAARAGAARAERRSAAAANRTKSRALTTADVPAAPAGSASKPAAAATAVPRAGRAAPAAAVSSAAPAVPAAAAVAAAESVAPEVVSEEATEATVEVPAPVDAVVSLETPVALAVDDPLADSGDLPATDAPLAWTMLAARRHSTSASLLGGNSITVNPNVEWGGTIGPDPKKGVLVATPVPGVLVATVNATSSKDLPFAYVGVGRPNAGGKIGGGPLLPLANFYGTNGGFSYIPNASTLTTPGATEQFRVMAMELSKFDQKIIKILGPLGGLLVPQLLAVIHRIPIIDPLLSPLIGNDKIALFDETPSELAGDLPTAFTYKMPSFDGTLISVNYFPAVNVALGNADEAPTVLAASGLACAANTDPLTRYGQLFPANQFGSLTPGIAPLREDAFRSLLVGGPSYNGGGGFNVVTWDPRGEFASGGQLNIDNPFLEGRDTSAIISWLVSNTNPASGQVATEAGDPLIGMTGGSYGGGIQLTTVDPRIDALTPEIGWNSLISSLYPDGAFKTGWATILAAALLFTGANVNPAVYQGILQGDILNHLTPSSEAVLASVGPDVLLSKEQAPTMLFQGIHDTLFPLSESVANGQTIQTSPADPPLKLFWFCGGHGDCDLPSKPAEQDAQGVIQNLQWLDQYVAKSGTPADRIKNFQWYDQNGLYFNSDYLPWDPNFNDQGTYNIPTADGGFLGLWPAGGGSGPYPRKDLPFSIVNAGKAWNAVNVDVTPPAGNQIVGSPTLSFDYTGRGITDTVYAQLVDNESGLVLSNIVTPVPVKLDGKTHTATISMEDIAYTAGANASLTLQITSSSINYFNPWNFGGIRISDINLALPQHQTVTPPPWTP